MLSALGLNRLITDYLAPSAYILDFRDIRLITDYLAPSAYIEDFTDILKLSVRVPGFRSKTAASLLSNAALVTDASVVSDAA